MTEITNCSFTTLLKNYLKRKGIKQNINVVELYMCKNSIQVLESLAQFRMLQRIWLNSNKLRNLFTLGSQQSFLRDNFRVTELYLESNEISDITGTISHLRYLQVLMLQKNQLANLNDVLQELVPLQALRVVNLFDNPLAQEGGYRLLVIHTLPSVELFDRQEVTRNERNKAREVHEAHREAIRLSVAFGRHVKQNPQPYPDRRTQTKNIFKTQSNSTGTSKTISVKDLDLQFRRSVMQFTTLDWSKIPTCEQRRLGEVVPPAENLTVKFR